MALILTLNFISCYCQLLVHLSGQLNYCIQSARRWMSSIKLKINTDKTKFSVFGSKTQSQKLSSHLTVNILGNILCEKPRYVFDADICFPEHILDLVMSISCKCIDFVVLDIILPMEWLSLWQMPWLKVVITTVAHSLVYISINPNNM